MKLTNLEITNYLGVKNALIQPRAPVTLIAGRNGAGKSSIAEALRMALLGESTRVALKKDYGHLLHGNAKSGAIAVQFGDRTAAVSLPDGKVKGTVSDNGIALEYCLDPARFAAQDAKIRRTFLFDLMGVKITKDEVKKRLQARGVDSARAEQVTPLLAAGFEAAQKEAQSKARDAKALWRDTTGEAYGSDKAKGWADAGPEPLAPDIAAKRGAAARDFDGDLATLNQHMGKLLAAQQAQDEAAAELEPLRAKVEGRERIVAKQLKDAAELNALEARVKEAEAKAGGEPAAKPLTCPHCSGLVSINGGALEQFTKPKNAPDPEAVAALPGLRQARDLLKRAHANDERDLAAANDAAQRVQNIEAMAILQNLPQQIAETQGRIAAIKYERDAHLRDVGHIAAHDAKAKQAQGRTEKAASLHADVQAWDEIAKAMAPDGIPGEFLAEAIEPFNSALAAHSDGGGWPRVAIDGDMNITAGGRAYGLRSESEKWRADALIAATIAQLSGVKFVMLDRFDVLDLQGRAEALDWLADITEPGVLDSAIVLGTLKMLPQGLDGIDGYWLENGTVGVAQEARAA